MLRKFSWFLVALILLEAEGSAQTRHNFSMGVNFLIPASIPDTNKAIGAGVNIKWERFFSQKISGNIKMGYHYFKGKIVTWDNKKEEKFAMIPALIGGRFYLKNFYLGSEIGIAIGANKNTGTNFALIPAIGYRIKHLDVALQLFGVPQAFASFPENTYFKKGGYSYLGLQVNYVF